MGGQLGGPLGRPLNLSYFKTSLICLILKLVSSLSMSCFSMVHFKFVFFKISHLSCVSFSVVSPIQLCLLLLLSFQLCLIFSCVSYSVVSHFTSVISLVSVFSCISFSVMSHFTSVISLVSVLVSDFSHSTSELSGQFRTMY